MTTATLFDLLGIARSLGNRAGEAAARWPADLVSLTSGLSNSSGDALAIVTKLYTGTTFTNIRPGVDGRVKLGSGAQGQITLAADMTIGGLAPNDFFYLKALPDLGIQLKATDPQHPARVYAAVDGRGNGYEVIIDRLPITLQFKSGFASAVDPTKPVSVGKFDNTAVDSFAYRLGDDNTSAQIDCFVRLHLTPEGDVILEPTVPLSLGAVRWMGLPAKAVYDIQLLPSPNRRDYFEWAHNDLGSFISNPPAKGAIGFRSIDLDYTAPPLSDLKNRLSGGAVNLDKIELVMEDVVVPATVPMLPIPSHGTFGFRRKITDPGDIQQAFSFSNSPVQVVVYQSGSHNGTTLTLEVDKFFFRTGDLNAIDPADAPQVQLQASLIYQDNTNSTPSPKIGGTVGIDDEWTINVGVVMDPSTTPVKMTVADTTVGLVGLKGGLSVSRLAQKMEFKDSFELLGDLFVQGKPKDPSSGSKIFQITSLTGKPLSVVMHDIGWKLGNPSLSGLQMPDGMQLIFADKVHVIIEEMGWVEEANGAPYFSFSGGVEIGAGGGNSSAPKGNAQDNSGNGFGIRVRRLRFRLNSDNSQPFVKLDGLFLKAKYGPVDIEGFGCISDYTDSGWAIKEWGFGAKVALNALAMQFSFSAMFMDGSRKNIGDPTQSYTYFLAALKLGYLPAGAIGLYDIRALVANNMAPNLDSTFPDGEGMALLKWHQSHDNALAMPVGCGFSLNGCGGAAHISLFIFGEKAAANSGLLIVGDLYLLKNPKSIAFVAIEYDSDKDKFGVMAGVDISLGDFAGGKAPDWLANIARLSGSIYFGNQPWSFAIGQLADQSTWLSLKIHFDVWLTIEFQVGVCVQIVDGGPKGFGVVVTLSAGADWGIGGFLLWGSFGLIIGTWKTGSDTSGLEFWIGLGFKINLFWIFNFGAEANLRLSYLGKHPWYVTLHAEVKIDTPWFLPDVTFCIDKTWQESMPFDTASTTQGLSQAEAIDPTAQKPTPLLLPGLNGALGDSSFLYTFNQLVGLQGVRIPDTHLRDDLVPVSIDSTIAVNFNQPVCNDTLIATTAPNGTQGADAGVQKVQDLTIRYGLHSISVRRAPRFGPNAGVWSDLVADTDTSFSIGGAAPETLTFAWDSDQRADGKLAPKRLLINSSAPYSFATAGAKNDEESVRNDPDVPCCRGTDERAMPKAHVLEFSALALGSRAPRNERFSGTGGAWWHWLGATTPAIVPRDTANPTVHSARFLPTGSVVAGMTDLPEPAAAATLDLSWDRLAGTLIFEAYAGTVLAGSQKVDLRKPGSTTLSITMPSKKGTGFSRLLVRFEMDSTSSEKTSATLTALNAFSPEAAVRIARATYITLNDMLAYVGRMQRCKNSSLIGPPGSDASGKLAFLPNHDYEVVVTTAVRVSSKDQGPRETLTSEAVYFRTKGLPGLNAAPNVGDDIRPHVAATYPMRRNIPLYRQEPCVLAFENSLSTVLPIDRTPGPSTPPEKAQMFPLELNVDRVASLDGRKRLTVPSNDWISEHRANPLLPLVWLSKNFASSTTRRSRSTDPLVLRDEALKLAVSGCAPQTLEHASQVLLHNPIGSDGTATKWEPQVGYRATVRQQNGPFAERSGFDLYDLGAFTAQTDRQGAAQPWMVEATGALVAPPATLGRSYAAFGEPDWDHLEVRTQIDLRSATAAGIAVGVAAVHPVSQAILATIETDGTGHALVLRKLAGGVEAELGRVSVTISGPTMLHVTAFDDVVRAEVGDIILEKPRAGVREGHVALIAQGPAAFATLSVTALDIYSFEFVTSRYGNFAEHLSSWDGKLAIIASGAFGGKANTAAAVLAAHGSNIPSQMTPDADPQARQALFATFVAELGIGLSHTPRALTLTRLNDASGTVGFLMQSPEPLSLTRDITLNLTHHVRTWVGGPITKIVPPQATTPHLPHGPISELSQRIALASATASRPETPTDLQSTISALQFTGGKVTLPSNGSSMPEGTRVARVVSSPSGNIVEIYDAPFGKAGARTESLTMKEAATRPELSGVDKLSPGAAGILRGGFSQWGHWEDQEVTVPYTALSNGDETVIMLLSQNGVAWPAGNYKLSAVLDRDRWGNTGPADPLQHYHEEVVLSLGW